MTTKRLGDFGLPPELLAQLEAVAAEEQRSVMEIIQEALERYGAKRLMQGEASPVRPVANQRCD